MAVSRPSGVTPSILRRAPLTLHFAYGCAPWIQGKIVTSGKNEWREPGIGLYGVLKFSLRFALVAATMVSVVGSVEPTSAEAETLTAEQAVATALEKNPDLLAARQELESARARVVKAHYLNQFNPQVQGGASQAHFQFAPGGNEPQPTGSVSLEVEVAGQRSKRIEEADQNALKARADV